MLDGVVWWFLFSFVVFFFFSIVWLGFWRQVVLSCLLFSDGIVFAPACRFILLSGVLLFCLFVCFLAAGWGTFFLLVRVHRLVLWLLLVALVSLCCRKEGSWGPLDAGARENGKSAFQQYR